MRKKEGHVAMEEWDKTWRPGHIPVWAKKAIRLTAIRNGNWNCYPAWPANNNAWSHLPHDLFDHFGTVNRCGVQVLIAQPYGNHDKLAIQFAQDHGFAMKSYRPGPWHEGTWCYEFWPKTNPTE